MENSKPFHDLKNDWFIFFQEFLKHPLQLGSAVPSSRFLERRIVETAGVKSAKTIVELGPGTGGTTRAILRAMPQDARLLSIELNPHLYDLISRIEDDRLISHLGTAHDLKGIARKYGLGRPEVIISGIPFSTMSRNSGMQILKAIASILAPRGCFVAYQVSKRIISLNQVLLTPKQIEMEFFNIPPMRVFLWEKTTTDHEVNARQHSTKPDADRCISP